MIFENKRMALHGVGDTYILLNNNNYLIIIKDAFFNVEHRPIRDYLNNSENFSILNFIFFAPLFEPHTKKSILRPKVFTETARQGEK